MAPRRGRADQRCARGVRSWSLPRPWLGDFSLALPTVGLVGTWILYGLALVLLLAGVQKIPTDLYEAARIDGAGPVREFLVVTLPGLRNEIVVVLVLTVTAALRNFDLIYVMTQGGPGSTTQVPSWLVYNQAFVVGAVGGAAAVGAVLAVLIFAHQLPHHPSRNELSIMIGRSERAAGYVILSLATGIAVLPLLGVLVMALEFPR